MSSQDVKASNSAQDEINDNAESLLLDDTHFNPLLYQEESLSLTDRTGTTAADEVIPSKVQFKPENDDSEEEYKLCGYLFMVASVGKTFVPGIKGRRNSVRKRWFVYSHKTCKLYYYKDKSGTEPLGTIDIVLATFIYDPEIKSQGQFTIQCGNEEYILEATNAQGRLYWLQQLQTARREFSQRRTTTLTSACKTTSNARPESGLLQVSGSYEYIPDPHRDLMTQVSRPSDPLRSNLQNKSPNSPLTEARSAISNFLPATHKKMFRPISESPRSPISPRSSRPLSMSSLSPLTSPTEDLSLGRIGRKLRNSMRVRRSSSFDEKDGESPLSPTCRRCRELHKELLSYREDLAATQDECGASREIINLLQKELDTLQQEKATLITLDRSDLTDDHILDILRIKDHRIIDLEHQNQQMTNEIAKIRDKIGSSQSHQEHLSEKIDMLTDLIEAKDAAIVHLTHKNCEDNSQGSSVDSLIVYEKISRGSQTTDQERDALKDALEAYRSQNTFLNKEILELNLLRKQASEREQRLIRESSEWEAKFYQIQSKYLLLLNELHSPSASQHDPAILTQLLQDVVQNHGAPDLRVVNNKGREYDEYGFFITAPEEGSLQFRATYLQKQSQILANHTPMSSSQWESKWESFLVGTSAKELPNCSELKYLIRGGIPYQYKGKVWKLLIDNGVAPYKAAVSANYYQDQLARHHQSSTLDPSAKQIELDLLRTLPNNRHYESFHSDGIVKLRRVLLAYSRHNPTVGYCQGLNRLAAIVLLFLNEEDAFWCLVYIVEFLQPKDYYNRNLLGSQVDQRVFKDLMAEKLPRLHNHFERHGLDVSLFTFNWFLCVYIDIIPHITFLTIWDSFLYEGSKVLFRYALAIFKLCEEGVLERSDYLEMFNYLRSIPEPITDIPRLQETAFNWVNPLSMRYLRNRRAHHLAIVQNEMAEVEAVRRSYHASNKKNVTKVEPAIEEQPPSSPSSENEDDSSLTGNDVQADNSQALPEPADNLEELPESSDQSNSVPQNSDGCLLPVRKAPLPPARHHRKLSQPLVIDKLAETESVDDDHKEISTEKVDLVENHNEIDKECGQSKSLEPEDEEKIESDIKLNSTSMSNNCLTSNENNCLTSNEDSLKTSCNDSLLGAGEDGRAMWFNTEEGGSVETEIQRRTTWFGSSIRGSGEGHTSQ